MDYIKETQSVQITSRIFIDDMERLIRERYDDDVVLAIEDESKKVNDYVEKYLKDKILIKINGIDQNLIFIGREYEDDIMYCYFEIQGVNSIKSFEITNLVLFDIFEEQQNIVRTFINSKHKSFILIKENDKGLLNFE